MFKSEDDKLNKLLASLDPNYQAPEFRMQGMELPSPKSEMSPSVDFASLRIPTEAAQSPSAPVQTTNPVVAEYIKKKYKLGPEFSDEKRQSIVDDNAKDAAGINWKAGFAALGAGLQGQNAAASGMSMLDQQEKARQSKVDQFDKSRNKAVEKFDFERKINQAERDDDLVARESDLNSEESKLAQTLAGKMSPGIDFSKMNATQINQKIPALSKIYDIEQKKLDRQSARQDKMDAKADKLASGKTLQGRLDGLKSSDRTRFDSAKMGRGAVADMKAAFDAGENTFSLVGDNNYTEARRRFEEALGRMQSGGAINKEEELRFKAMAPTVTDSKTMQIKKLQNLENEMNSRLKTLGFEPEELGFNQEAKPQFPRTVSKGNEVATVSDESELKEALQEGFQ